MPVVWIYVKGSDNNHKKNDSNFNDDHRCIKRCAFTNSFHQYDRYQKCSHDRRKIEYRSGRHKMTNRRIIIKWRCGKRMRKFDAQDSYKILEVMRPSMRDRC